MATVNENSSETETGMETQEEPDILFVPDENVKIISLRKLNSRQDEDEDDKEEYEEVPKNNKNEHDDDLVIKSRVLTIGSTSGNEIFGFKTPKRKEALAAAAQNSIQSGKKSAVKSKSKDNSSGLSSRKPLKQLNRKAPLFIQETQNSDEESEEQSESESDDDGVSGDSSKKKDKDLATTDILDQYFEVHSSKGNNATSDKTLSRLTNPKLRQEDLVKHLKDSQSTHINETASLIRLHSCHFQNWMFQMINGYNVLLYGLGSKHNLLEEFRKQTLKEQVHIVINGFFPSITIKQILSLICDDVIDGETAFKSLVDQANYIKDIYQSDRCGKLFLVIHNIDGQMLRPKNTQSVLATLASSKHIHIIASIDHINAPLIWDQNISSMFNWLWYDCTTYESYNEETSYENSLMVQQSGSLALSSLIHVLRSLTPNAKGIFKLLVNIQLDNEDNASYQGLSFSDLYNRCREQFLVNSDLTLRAQLTEFKDHKLIKTKKGFNGLEYLSIALDCGTLRQYLEHESNT